LEWELDYPKRKEFFTKEGGKNLRRKNPGITLWGKNTPYQPKGLNPGGP